MAVRTLRRLQGVTYWVINDRDEIREFINSNVKREWERDNKEDGIDSRKDDWLLSLPKREWRLRILEIAKVRLNPSMMARRTFVMELKRRSEEMRRSMSEYYAVIWPLVVRGEDYELKDGYCRFTALKGMGATKVMAYVGVL